MTKRKVVGGYEESSDESEPELNVLPAKTPRPASAPPRRDPTLNPGTSGFQLPSSVSTIQRSRSAGILRTGRKPVSPVLSSGTGKARKGSASMDLDDNQPDSEVEEVQPAPVRSTPMPMLGNGAPAKPSGPISLSARTGSARSNLSLERQVNELASKLEKQQQESDRRTQITDDKLTRILEVMTTLVPGGVATPGEPKSATASGSATPAPPEPKPYLANPLPTPELIDLLTKVCGDPRSRSAQKGALSGEAEHTVKEHVRNTFKEMLGIPSLKVVRPYFLNQYGQPDTIPEQFVDPETGYGVPHPNWDVGLSLQPHWIPTYLLRFRGTIPNDTSEKATLLRALTDEQILIMLHDGPFRTAVISWRREKKSESELEALRSGARRYQRANRRLCVRRSYLHQIPSLQGPEWEFLTHIGYMSQEESDDEGVLVTKRPSYRAQWVNNLFEAVAVAEQGRPRRYVTPLLIPPIVRRIETVMCPIPKLEQGKGASKYSLLVAACSLSKRWREEHPGEVQAYMHLVNLRVVTKPNIDNFLTKYSMPEPSLLGEPGDYDGMTGLDMVGEYDGAFGTHARSDNVEPDAVVDNWQGGDETGETTETKTGAADIPIDPTLLNADPLPSQDMPAQSSAGDDADKDKAPGPSNLDCEVAPNLTHPGDRDPASARHNQSTMPAPPPLELQSLVNTQDDGSRDVGPMSAKDKKGALKVANNGTRKPRGRPPGSKNKPKTGK